MADTLKIDMQNLDAISIDLYEAHHNSPNMLPKLWIKIFYIILTWQRVECSHSVYQKKKAHKIFNQKDHVYFFYMMLSGTKLDDGKGGIKLH